MFREPFPLKKRRNWDSLPVDAGDDMVHPESRMVMVILFPDPTSCPYAIVGTMQGIIDGDDDGQQPRHDGQNLVSDDSVLRVGFALGEGIDYNIRKSIISNTNLPFDLPQHQTRSGRAVEGSKDEKTYFHANSPLYLLWLQAQ